MLNSRAVVVATVIGTVLQTAMVVAGHTNASIAAQFAVGGMGISLVAGMLYAKYAGPSSTSDLVKGGAIAGGLCAVIGICISFVLGDVTAMILLIGTLSSAVTGALGGFIGGFVFRRAPVSA
jgi:hypothetical protein